MCLNTAKSGLLSCFSPRFDMSLYSLFFPEYIPAYFNYYQNIGLPGFCSYNHA